MVSCPIYLLLMKLCSAQVTLRINFESVFYLKKCDAGVFSPDEEVAASNSLDIIFV